MPGSVGNPTGEEWDFCDRSPCKALLGALGYYIFGDPETGGYVMAFIPKSRTGPVAVIAIRYCPFCGTRLDTLQVGIERYVRCKV
jgi:hypothetical protein